VLRIAADGTGRPDTLAIGVIPTVSPDGRYVLFSKVMSAADWDLSYLSPGETPAQESVLLRAPGWQQDPRVAPGGDYVAYMSNESGKFEIYLTRFPSGQGRWQVSVGGGEWARWSQRGDRLYYVKGDDVMAVDVTLGASPALGTPQRLFSRPTIAVPTIGGYSPGFDVSTDGERFVFFRDPQAGVSEHQVVVVQNWFAEFRAPNQ
jgi:Tol biopolymer transport system component